MQIFCIIPGIQTSQVQEAREDREILIMSKQYRSLHHHPHLLISFLTDLPHTQRSPDLCARVGPLRAVHRCQGQQPQDCLCTTWISGDYFSARDHCCSDGAGCTLESDSAPDG